MDPVEVIFEARHSEPLKLFRPYEVLYRSLTGQDLPDKQTVLPGFELNVEEKQMRIFVEPRRTAMVLGNVPNVGHCVDTIMSVLDKVGEVIQLPTIIRLGLRTYWIEKSEAEFAELVSRLKGIFCQSVVFADEATDIGLSFILRDAECEANVNFGPMELSQLRTRLHFQKKELPEVLTFLDVDYYLITEPRDVEHNMIRQFVSSGIKYATEQSQKLTNVFSEAKQ